MTMPDLRKLTPEARDSVRQREGWQDRFVVMFAGNLGLLQGLDTVVRACRELSPTSRVLVVMVGDGVDGTRLQQLASDDRDGRSPPVRAAPVAASDMAGYDAAADALLVHLRESPIAPLIVPSKTVAYLAAGKPIVMASVGAAADIVSNAGAGVVLRPDDAKALAGALEAVSALSDAERALMGARGRAFFESHFTKRATLPTYVAALKRVAAGADRSAR